MTGSVAPSGEKAERFVHRPAGKLSFEILPCRKRAESVQNGHPFEIIEQASPFCLMGGNLPPARQMKDSVAFHDGIMGGRFTHPTLQGGGETPHPFDPVRRETRRTPAGAGNPYFEPIKNVRASLHRVPLDSITQAPIRGNRRLY